MAQFYFLSILLNILVGLILVFGENFLADKFEDDEDHPESGRTFGDLGLDSPSFRMVVGILCVFVALMKILSGVYRADEGEIFVDGVNVKEYDQEALHNKIGYVSQKAVMFSDTVINNVDYGDNGKPEKTEEQIKRAIEVAQGKEFIEKMEDGYNSHIAQGGTNISGGQKQRISIARAIARDPEIYIFDDSFSALDYKTDATLRKELKEYTKDATSMIVAQRIGTIINADKIIVLDKGRCVGQGTHKELLKNCEVYKEIALSQLSEEELASA